MDENEKKGLPAHFKGKDAIEHVIDAQARGIIDSAEIHGTEIPGHLSSGADAARETSILLLMIWFVLTQTHLPSFSILQVMIIFSLGLLIWKGGRSAWLGWFRLERMHRVVEQERWEIQHHRSQEREELKELYRAKGFEGKLLDDVIDVLMADEDRLLRVMVEEELCLNLGSHVHPLKQAAGAAVGTLAAIIICLVLLFAFPTTGLWIGSFLTLTTASVVAAYYEGNRLIPALVWNLGLGALASSTVFFLYEYFK